jgi:aminocarboxymuconate-semialdehyde decarboxylase
VIDVHAHYVPQSYVEQASRAPGSLGATLAESDEGVSIEIGSRSFLCPTPGVYDDGERLLDMDAAGVDVHVLAPAPFLFYYWAEPELALEVARLTNDSVAASVAAHPDRFVGLATVPLSSPDALAEMERAVSTLGLHGITVGSAFKQEHIDGPTLRPVLRRAAELDVPVFVHPHNLAPFPGLEDFYLINLVGNPMATTVALARFIYAGVLEELPSLRTYWAHLGGYASLAAGRLDHGFNVRPEARDRLPAPPSSYLEKVWVDAIAHDHRMVHAAADVLGRDKVVLGTDYNFDMGLDRPRALIEAVAETDDDLAQRVAFRNATELFANVPDLAEKAHA